MRCGTRAAYAKGCRCEPCRRAAADYRRERARTLAELAHGARPPAWVPTGPVADHVAQLRAAGMTVRHIARLAGTNHVTITKLGERSKMRAETAARILAIQPTDEAAATVPALGATRRLQALARLGWTMPAVDAAISDVAYENILHGKVTRIRPGTMAAVAALYDRLHMTLPPDTAAARHRRGTATRNGWAPPLAWDDIDTDPRPVGMAGKERCYCDDVAFMLDDGQHPHQIAARVGVKPQSMVKHLRRHGRRDLTARINDINAAAPRMRKTG